MLNMIDTQDKLKNFSEAQLIGEMQMPSGSAPQFMVLGEIERRKRMRQDAQRQEGLMQPTVAQEAISGAGVPQQGLAGLAQSLAPKTDMTQNTGVPNAQAANLPAQPNQPQRMADGGVLRLAPGGSMSGGTLAAIANLKVMRPDLYEEYKDDPEMLELTAEFVLTSAKDSEMTGLESLAAEQAASVSAADDFVARWPGDTPSQQAQVAKDKGDGGVAAALAAEADTRRRVAEENIAMGMPVPTNDFRTFPGPNVQTSVDALGVPLVGETMVGFDSPQSDDSTYGPAGLEERRRIAEQQNQARLAEAAGIDARAARMMEVNQIPERGLPELTSQRRAVDTPAYQGLQDLLQERREYADSESTANAKADAQRDDTLRFLRGAEGAPTDNRSLIDAIDRDDGLANSDEVISDNMGIRSGLFFPKSFPEVTSLNRRAQEYMQSDMYTPPEEIYDLSPQGRLKYENAPDGEFTTGTDGAMLSSEANAAINAVQKADSRRQEADSRRAATQNMRDTAASIASLEDFQIAPESGTASVVADTPPTAQDDGAVNYANLPAWKLAQLADEGDDQAINQMRLNELGALSTASDMSMGGDDLYMDRIMRETLREGPLDAVRNRVYSVQNDLGRTQSTITNLEEFIKLNPNNAQAIAQLEAAKAEAERLAAEVVTAKKDSNVAESTTGIAALPKTTPEQSRAAKQAAETQFQSVVDIEKKAIADAAAKKTPITPVDKPGGGTTSSGSGQGRIADLIASRKKEADQNKWLALAQAGMSLMSTGDFGKAGQEGLAALMAQRESMNKFDTDMIKMESDLVLNNARLEAARRSGVTKPKAVPAAYLTDLRKQMEAKQEQLARLKPAEAGGIFSKATDPDAALRIQLEKELQSIQGQIDFMYSSRGLPTVSGDGRTKV